MCIRDRIRPISDLRTRLNHIENLARETREPIIMTKNGTASLIVIDSDAYDCLLYTSEARRREGEYARRAASCSMRPFG